MPSLTIAGLKIDPVHALLFLAVLLSAVGVAYAGQFPAGSTPALLVILAGTIGQAIKSSIVPSVTANAAIKNAAEEIVK